MRFQRWASAVLALAALLLLFRLGERALWGPEGRWAEVTREMRLTGDYFWPTINGEVYFEKPLFSYWLMAGTAFLNGGLDEFSVRLPSALAGIAGVALLIVLARRLYGDRTAILAGIVLATSYSYVYWSRVGSADVQTVAGVLAAMTLYGRNRERPDGWWVAGLWVIMALTSLTKGLQGFALPLFIIGIDSFLAGGWRELGKQTLRGPLRDRLAWLTARTGWFFNRKTVPAVALGASVYALPFALSFAATDSHLGLVRVYYENFVRFLEPFDHKAPFYIYGYEIFSLLAPWSLFLPAALAHAHSRPPEKADRLVLVYFWATFVFFTLSGSRRSYYLLPILPAAAILIARLLASPRETWTAWVRRLGYGAYGLIALSVLAMVLAAGLALFLPPLRPEALRELPWALERTLFWGFWVSLPMVVAAAIPILKRRPESMAFSTSFIAYAFMLFVFVHATPASDELRDEKAFAQGVRATLGGNMDGLVLYGTEWEGLLYYLAPEKPVPVARNTADLAKVIRNDTDAWIVALERHLPALPPDAVPVLASREFRLGAGFESEYVLVHLARNTGVKDQP